MKPWQHARGSVAKWGGKPEDYLPLHDFFDQTKAERKATGVWLEKRGQR